MTTQDVNIVTINEVRNGFFYYVVHEYVTTFGKDPGKHDPISHYTTFDYNDINQSRREALDFFLLRSKNIMDHGRYFLPFPKEGEEFVEGVHAVCSMRITFCLAYEDYIKSYVLCLNDLIFYENIDFEKKVIQILDYEGRTIQTRK